MSSPTEIRRQLDSFRAKADTLPGFQLLDSLTCHLAIRVNKVTPSGRLQSAVAVVLSDAVMLCSNRGGLHRFIPMDRIHSITVFPRGRVLLTVALTRVSSTGTSSSSSAAAVSGANTAAGMTEHSVLLALMKHELFVQTVSRLVAGRRGTALAVEQTDRLPAVETLGLRPLSSVPGKIPKYLLEVIRRARLQHAASTLHNAVNAAKKVDPPSPTADHTGETAPPQRQVGPLRRGYAQPQPDAAQTTDATTPQELRRPNIVGRRRDVAPQWEVPTSAPSPSSRSAPMTTQSVFKSTLTHAKSRGVDPSLVRTLGIYRRPFEATASFAKTQHPNRGGGSIARPSSDAIHGASNRSHHGASSAWTDAAFFSSPTAGTEIETVIITAVVSRRVAASAIHAGAMRGPLFAHHSDVTMNSDGVASAPTSPAAIVTTTSVTFPAFSSLWLYLAAAARMLPGARSEPCYQLQLIASPTCFTGAGTSRSSRVARRPPPTTLQLNVRFLILIMKHYAVAVPHVVTAQQTVSSDDTERWSDFVPPSGDSSNVQAQDAESYWSSM